MAARIAVTGTTWPPPKARFHDATVCQAHRSAVKMASAGVPFQRDD